MSEPKTIPTDESVDDFLNRIKNPQRRKDGFLLLEMMRDMTKEEPTM